jgi:hypothetical protein
METKIDIKRALRVFNIITRRGSKTSDGWSFDGLDAQTDADGYTVTLSDPHNQLTIYFHNSHRFTFANKRGARDFIKRMAKIDGTVE